MGRACAGAVLAVALLSQPARADSLPLGDGKVTRAPEIGHVFACPTRFEGGGAFRDGPWIRGNVWDPPAKPVVGGAAAQRPMAPPPGGPMRPPPGPAMGPPPGGPPR